MTSKIVDQYGRPFEQTKAVTKREDLGMAPVADKFRDYVADGLTPERLASLFRQADAGYMRSQAELFETLEERDGHLLCERDKRRNNIIDLQYNLTPASDSARDLEVMEFVKDTIDNFADWDESMIALQDAVGKGFSSLELKWDVSSGQAMVTDMPFLRQQRFLFHDEAGMLTNIPRLITEENPLGEDIPAFSSITHVYGGKSGNATRSAIYRVCAWMVLFKTYSIKDWAVFCELFGMPLRLGRYDSGASEDDKRALRLAVTNLGSDAAGIISKSTEIEFIETVSTAKSELWESFATFCNAETSKAILGQTLSAQTGKTGSYAASKTHNEVRIDLLKGDGRMLASTVRNQFIKPLVGFNFGFDTALPEYKATHKEAEDLKLKADWMSTILPHVAMPLSYINKSFSIPEQQGNEVMVGGVPVPGTTELPAKVTKLIAKEQPENKPSHEDVLSALEEKAMGEVNVDQVLAPIEALLESATSLEDFRDKLIDTFIDMDASEMGSAISRAMILAETAGRFDGENGDG